MKVTRCNLNSKKQMDSIVIREASYYDSVRESIKVRECYSAEKEEGFSTVIRTYGYDKKGQLILSELNLTKDEAIHLLGELTKELLG